MLLCGILLSRGEPFANLDFEEVSQEIAFVLGTWPTGELLPSWRVFQQEHLLTEIGFNALGASIYERPVLEGQFHPLLAGTPPDKGKYVLFLDQSEGRGPYDLVQRGDVPKDTSFIKINGGDLGIGGSFRTYMNEIEIIDGDISQFAGKNVELRIISDREIGIVSPGFPYAFIDSIDLLAHLEPEPIRLSIELVDQWILLSWGGKFTLSFSSTVDGPFFPVKNSPVSPFLVPIRKTMFYRVEQ